MVDIDDASHPFRRAAIRILEDLIDIGEMDQKFNEDWFSLEDRITEIIKEEWEKI